MFRAVYATAVCCKEWPIAIALDGRYYGPASIRRCGLCGEQPRLTEDEWEYVEDGPPARVTREAQLALTTTQPMPIVDPEQ
jgi:hypothetical protein